MQLDPLAAAAGVGLDVHDRLGSTNAEALALARAGERGPTWIVAREQTAGRGRRGREWVSPPGNLYATLLLADPGPPERAAELSFAAALALHDAVVRTAPALAPALLLKWPNDLLLGEAKCAGILIESEAVGRDRLALAVGIGVNCAHHPHGLAQPTTDLAAAGAAVAPDTLFAALSAAMQRRLLQWNRGVGFAAVRADWLARAAGLGATIRVRLPEREMTGRFETLDDNGRLMLRTESGLVPVTAGEVFGFAPPATARRSA